jgi:Uma2 family endonuclease
MARAADELWTLEEFLAFDDGTDTSYQLFEGRIVAMNPRLRGHGALVARLITIVADQLKPPCEACAGSGIIPVNRRHSWYKADPVLVVEVLSPTTSATDFNRKLPDYQQIPSMWDVLLVSSMERLIRHWRREPNGWIEHGHRRSATVRLTGLPVAITMSDLYEGILPE